MKALSRGGIAVVLASAALTACGGDDEGESGDAEDFVAAADAACTEFQRAGVDLQLELGYDQDEQETAERLTEIVTLREGVEEELAAIEIPAAEQAEFDEWLSLREEQTAALEKNASALESGDSEAAAKAQAAATEAGDGAKAAASDLGLVDCALELPEDDAQAAEDALREFATTADPETSCNPEGGLVTEVFVEDGFGGQEACEEDQRKIADDLPEDIEVSEIEGVDDVAAFIEFEDVGGKYDGEPSSATLYYLDGEWKLNIVSLAA